MTGATLQFQIIAVDRGTLEARPDASFEARFRLEHVEVLSIEPMKPTLERCKPLMRLRRLSSSSEIMVIEGRPEELGPSRVVARAPLKKGAVGVNPAGRSEILAMLAFLAQEST